MNINPEDIDVENLLGNKFFTIPQFQRPYSWGKEQLSDFWEDFIEKSSHEQTEHFFGSMVVYALSNKDFGVVDGQQRLTTLTILLCVIRDQFDELGNDNLGSGIHRLIQREDLDFQSKFVVTSETTTPYFQDFIQVRGNSKIKDKRANREEKRIQEARTYLKERLNCELSSCADDAAQVEKLIKIRKSILASKIILITLDNISDAYVIFETLNTRGLELSYSDLLKNYLLELIGNNDGYDYFNNGWQRILQDLSFSQEKEVNIDQFIYHYWNSVFKYSRKKDLYNAAKSHIGDDPEIAMNFFEDLRKNARYYVVISSPNVAHELDKHIPAKMQNSLNAILQFKVKQANSGLLSLMRAYQDDFIKEKQACSAFRSIENFHFIFTAINSSRSSETVQRRYCLFAQKIESFMRSDEKENRGKICKNIQNEIKSLQGKLSDALPERVEFETRFRKIRYIPNSPKTTQLIRYILNNIRAHFGISSKDDSTMTIEHIIPCSWAGKTADDLEIDKSSPSYFEGVMPKDMVNSIGNLVLINKDLNNELGNMTFDEKREKLKNAGVFDGTFPEGSDLAWTVDKIKTRTEEIIKLGWEEIWSL
jgi:rloF protein